VVPLTRLNGGPLHLNADLIAMVEEHHDTVVTLVDGKCLVVKESAEQVVAAIIHYRAQVRAVAEQLLALPPTARPQERSGSGDALVLTLRPGIGE
jgi:flagellar protein FlbD